MLNDVFFIFIFYVLNCSIYFWLQSKGEGRNVDIDSMTLNVRLWEEGIIFLRRKMDFFVEDFGRRVEREGFLEFL